jgi:hypothetical protein
MTAAVQIIAAATGSRTVQFNANECDLITICASPAAALGAGETITINLITSGGDATPLWNPQTGAVYTITGPNTNMTIPGGMLYQIVKGNTAIAVGVDVFIKPRIGFSGA